MKYPTLPAPVLAILALALALAVVPCAAQAAEGSPATYATQVSVDWQERVLRVQVELDLVAAGLRLPEGRLDAQRMIDRDIPALAKDAVFSLPADSHRTVEDAVQDGSIAPESLVALAGTIKGEDSSFSKDLRRFVARYSLSLDAVASLFLTGAQPAPIRRPMDSAPTRDYTGIVVYAKGSLPVHGEAVEGRAQPCLFPRIYDTDMNLVLDKSLVRPEVLSGQAGAVAGVLGYERAIGVEARARVGTDPLRVMAVELFGDNRTDYLISREDALRILSSAGNRALLSEGRVVVVY